MRRYGLTFVVLLLASVANGAELKIEGKEKVPAGGYAEFKVKLEKGDIVGWQVFPPPVQQTVLSDTICFALTQGQTYTVGATVVNFEAKRFDQGTKTVAFDGVSPTPNPGPSPGPGPNPVPVPVPTPIDKFGLVKASHDGARLNIAANAKQEAELLASANRSLASAIAAGGIQPDTPKGYLDAWRAYNAGAGVTPANWSLWNTVTSTRLREVNETLKLLKTRADWAQAFNDIAAGLEAR